MLKVTTKISMPSNLSTAFLNRKGKRQWTYGGAAIKNDYFFRAFLFRKDTAMKRYTRGQQNFKWGENFKRIIHEAKNLKQAKCTFHIT